MMPGLTQDLRYALRQLRKSPGFAITAMVTLALAVGITTAVFSVIYAELIRPLPYDHPDQIVHLETWSPQGYTQPASYPEYLDWRHNNHVFSALAAYNDYDGVNFDGPTGPVALSRISTTDNFFDVFGVEPILGRTFASGEDQPGKADVVVLSYDVWREHFQSRREAIGENVRLGGHPYTVIGVMPAGFRFPIGDRNAIYTPLNPTRPDMRENRGSHWLPTVARLKPGVSLQQAEADMATVLENIGQAFPAESLGRRMRLQKIDAFVVGDTAAPLTVLFFSVLGLLAIGCLNIAGLLLARGVKREREIALRSAVGATRSRIIRQMLTEAIFLALIGSLAGVLFSYLLLDIIRSLLIVALSRGADVRVNLPVMMGALAVAALTTLAAAILPSLRLSAIAPSFALKVGGSAGSSRSQSRLRALFVMTQLAMALVLLVTSGLLLRVLAGLRSTDLGFSSDHLLATEIDLSVDHYRGRNILKTFYEPLLEQVRALPGVKSAGLIQLLPIREWGWNGDTHIVGKPPNPPHEERLAEQRFVSPDYFDTMGIRVVRGRMLDPRIDTPTSHPVMVVNEAFVKKFFAPGEDPIGQHIDDFDKAEIVGVVRDIRQDLYQPPLAEMDFCIAQIPTDQQIGVFPRMQLLVRTEDAPTSIIPDVRRIFHDLDPGLPFRQPEIMRDVIDDILTFEHLENWLFGSFAFLAILLALVGLFALVSHEVELTTRDIGVRMALGATRSLVLSMIYRRVGLMVLGGVAAGVILTEAVEKLLASVVVIHAGKDAAVIIGLAAALFIAGIIAVLAPVLRAAKVDPTVALRYE
jgi:putative ABC transport system permease protein